MISRGPVFSIVPIDLSVAGTQDFNKTASTVTFLRAIDSSGQQALDALVNVQLGDVISDAIPMGINATASLREPTGVVRFSWAAQPGVIAHFLLSADDNLVVTSPPAKQLVTQSFGVSLSMSNVNVGTVAAKLAPANSARAKLTIRNNSAGNIIYMGKSSAVTAASGFPLAPGEAYTFDGTTAEVWGIASAAGTDVRVIQEGG